MLSMKSISLICLALCFALGAKAQKCIRSSRIEVTHALDKDARAEVLNLLKPYKARVDSLMSPVLGESLIAMGSGRPESLLGNWAADALLWATQNDSCGRADFALLNVGGLRNNMPKGTVRRGDIMLISPFENRLSISTLKGKDVLELMRNIASVGGEAVSREVHLEISAKNELLKASISSKPIDPERTYRIATIDYLAEGNDKMVAMKAAIHIRHTPRLLNEILMSYVQEHKTINAAIEGRIIIK